MNNNGIGFGKYCSNLINDFDVFKKHNSWHKSGFPFNVCEYQDEECTNVESLFQRVAWFNLSASLRKSHLNYIARKMNKYEKVAK
jgi:hypothetical protein